MDLVFEDGEYEKSLIIQAVDDDLSEPEEFFVVTIYDAQGAEFIEDANRFTVCIHDNDPYVDSHVFFAQPSVRFDKSMGSALLEVTRTGGTQYVFSVDFATISGSAVAGVDFAHTEGTLLFNCGEETVTIEIPLINDNLEVSEPDKSFSVILSDPKGGSIVEEMGEARVYLYNSAAQDTVMNIATLVTDGGAIDISAKAGISVEAVASSGDKIKVVPKVKESVPLLEAEPPAGIGPMAIVDPQEWALAPNQGGWKKYTMLANDKNKFGFGSYYAQSDDAYRDIFSSADSWHTRSAQPKYGGKGSIDFGFEYDDGETRVWKIWDATSADPYGYAIMKDRSLDGLWEFYKHMNGHVSMQFNNIVLMHPWDPQNGNEALFLLSKNETRYSRLREDTRDQIHDIVFRDNLRLARHVGSGREETVINLPMQSLLQADQNFVYYDRFVMALLDHSWENNTYFRNWVDDLYLERAALNNLQYEVVCKDGDDYLEANSSTILNQITPKIKFDDNQGGTDHNGKLYVGSNLLLKAPETAGAFSIKSVELRKKENNDWTTINTGNVSADQKAATIQLRSGSYIKAQRVRDLSSITAETAEYSLYVVMERNQTIKIDYSPSILPQASGETDEQYLARVEEEATKIANARSNLSLKIQKPELHNGQLTNTFIDVAVTDLTDFDFNLKNGDQLLYDKQMFGEAVMIKQEDYTVPELVMLFYDAEAMSREQVVRISAIQSITMYLDENGNGIVDENDTLLAYLHDGKYVNSYFAPAPGKDGQMKQKLLHFDYVKVPRKIIPSPADDPDIRYDMKASFMTTAVDEAELQNYTLEMRAVREIDTGATAVPIYGAEAAKGSITVPLGGDYSPPLFVEGEGGGWMWDPDFKGNLKTHFVAPAPVAELATVVGNKAIPQAQTYHYLGSFRNRDQVILNLYDESGNIVDNYNSVATYRDIVIGAIDQDQDLSAENPEGSDDHDTPGVPEPSVSLPELNIEAGPFKVVLEGDRAGFELGIPLFGAGTQDKDEQDTGLLGPNRSKYFDDMKDAFGEGEKGKNIFDQLKKAASKKDDKGADIRPKADVDVSFMLAFNASFMWKYSNIDGQWHFDEARIFVTVKGELKITQRLPPVPIVYVYIIFTGELELGLNINMEEIIDAEGLRTSEAKFSGELSLKIEVEAGVGVGVDLFKFEIYLKINMGFTVELSVDDTGVKTVEVGGGLGFRVVILFFTYEMDAIAFKLTYERYRQPDEWEFQWFVFGQEMNQAGQMGLMEAAGELNRPPQTKLYLSGRAYGEQVIHGQQDGMMPMAIPTPHGFELGEYNEGAASVQLAENLRYSADYNLFALGGENYILYMIDGGPSRSVVDADMLVLSKIGNEGLLDPAGGAGTYTVVDRVYGENDPKGDLDFDLHVDGTTIKAAWVDYRTVTPDKGLGDDLEAAMAGSAANTQVKYATYDIAAGAADGFGDARILGTPDHRFNYLPRVATVGGRSVVLSAQAVPYTQADLDNAVDDFKENLINQLNAADEDDAKSKYPYFDFKVGNFKNTCILYGKHSTFSFAVEKADGEFAVTEIVPTADWKKNGTRIEQAALYGMSGSDFYMAYTTSYNYLDILTNMTAKHLYLRRGTIDGDGNVTLDSPLLLRSLVDSDDDTKDGIYSGANLVEPFIDPFFSGLEFVEGKLDPAGNVEPMLIFNMNNRYYVIDEQNLNLLINEQPGLIKPFFELGDDAAGDSKADFSIGVDGGRNISAVYTSPVPHTNNNAVFMTKYDPHTQAWGRGIMLAMRDMSIYESSIDEGWSAEETAAEYYNSENGDARLVFQKPRVVIGEEGSLLLVAQTALLELEEVWNPMTNENVKMPAKDPQTGFTRESKRGFYAMSFPVGTRQISSPSLLFDNYAFVGGSVLSPRILFRNVGDFALRGSAEKPLKISLMLGDSDGAEATILAEWDVVNSIPSGATVDTLLNSEDTVYGQIGTQILADPLPAELDDQYLYFTVREDAGVEDQFNYSSLDLTKPEMEGVSYYSTEQNKAELVLERVSIRQGGEIVTIGGVPYLPLDITAMVKNYGQVTAAGSSLKVQYRETNASGEKSYLPATEIGLNGVVQWGDIEPGEQKSFITNNSDYEKDEDGNFIIQTDGTLKPYTDNDLLIPLSYFDGNAVDKSLELRFEVKTDTPEFEYANNISFASLPPLGSIKIADNISLVPNTPRSFEVKIESSVAGDPDIRMTELQFHGRAPLLKDTMGYDAQSESITIETMSEGDTVLRVADGRTAAFKDVIVKAAAQLPSAPAITDVEPRDGSALVFFDPPQDTGGMPIIRYELVAKNIKNPIDKITKYPVVAGWYEFTDLTNGQTYQFTVAAVNAAGTGTLSDPSADVTPVAGSYHPMHPEMPVISAGPASATVELGESVNLEVTAAVNDGGDLSYQWYSNTVASASGGSEITGETAATYAPPTTSAGVKYYYCVVTNTNNDAIVSQTATATSAPAAVNVGKATPVIILNAGGGTVYQETVILTAELGGLDLTPPTGMVRFESNNVLLADLVPIENGIAVYNWEGVSAGEQELVVIYYGDANYASVETEPLVYNIARADQEALAIAGIAKAVTWGSGPYNLEVSGGSGTGSITYSVTGDALSVDEHTGIVTIHKPGQAIITASRAGDRNYNERSAMLEITVNKADQEALEITGITKTVTWGSGPYAPEVSGGSGTGSITYSVTGDALRVDEHTGLVTIQRPGQAVITATKAGDEYYNERSAMLEITVNKADQEALEITGITKTVTHGSRPYTLEVSGGSGTGSITYSVTGDALRVDEHTGLVTIQRPGQAVITATKAGDEYYNERSAMFKVTVEARPVTASAPVPITATTQRISAASGGTLSLDGVSVIIPPGALPGDATFSINKLTTEEAEQIVPEGLRLNLAGDIYEINTTGDRDFGEHNIMIKLPYDPEKIGPGELPVINYYDAESGEWFSLETALEQDPDRQWYAVVQVNHLTPFAVFSTLIPEQVWPLKAVRFTIGSMEADINGEAHTLEAAPFIKAGTSRTLVPLRFIGEALGARVVWLPKTRQVEIKDNGIEIILTLDTDEALLNNKPLPLDCPAQLLTPPGRTFVPLRFVSEALGAEVLWDAPTRGITITR